MGKFFSDFKEFAMKGNVIDMAVGVIIGGAFGKIVSSLVNDVIMPVMSVCTGGLNFKDLKHVITPATEEAAEVAITYGVFIQNIVDFLIAERFENMRGDPALVVQIAGDDLHGLLQRMLLRRQFFLDFLQMHLEHIVQQRINVLIVIIEGLAVDFAVVHNVLYRNLLQRLLL